MNAERILLESALSDFAGGRLSPGELARRLDDFCEARDEAVRDIAFTMETFCEDGRQQTIACSRDGWNLIQRCLLFLRSGTPFREDAERWQAGMFRRRMGLPQWLAVGAVLVAVWLFAVSRNPFAYWYVGLLAAGCLLLCPAFRFTWAGLEQSIDGVPMERLYPFESARQILRARRRAPGFAKQPYPDWIERRYRESYRRTGRSDTAMTYFIGALFALAAWPVILPLLCLPYRVPRTEGEKGNDAALENKG